MIEEKAYHISVEGQETPTRDDIVIDYQPEKSTTNYSYTIIKDGKRGKEILVDDDSTTRIVLSETGHYKIEFTNYLKNGEIKSFETGKYIVDKEAPKIQISKESLKVKEGATVDIMEGVHATDNEDGDITVSVSTNFDKEAFSTPGEKKVTYKVTDTAGNTAFETVTFEVIENHKEIEFLQDLVSIGLVCVVIIIMLKYYRSLLLEKRIEKFSLQPKGKVKSIFDRIILFKNGIVDFVAKKIGKHKMVKTYAKTYEKYQIAFRESSTVHIVAKKILMSLLFLIASLFAATLRLEILSLVEMLIALLLGFIAMDLIYMIRYHYYRNHVENDLLQAIIVMNNAFKSGHSIPQAVSLVAQELDGDIHEEFERMRKEFDMGLSTDEVFNRFAERVEIVEVNYINSSLSILNDTGGNIVKVFTSIEKSLMNKKRLRLELKALTSSAKIVSYVLMLLPLFFALVISIISPDYFLPLVTSITGWLTLIVILAVYALYVCLVKKIMKVRM